MYRPRKRSYNTTFPVVKRRPTYATGRNLGTLPASRGFAPYYGTRRNRNTSARAVEMKYFDDRYLGLADIAAAPRLIYCPTQGTGATNRIGRKTLVRKIFIRGTLLSNPAQLIDGTHDEGVYSSLPVKCRVILFWDMQPNGVQANISELLQYNISDANIDAMLNLNYRDRFRVVKDKTYLFDPVTVIVNGLGVTERATFNRTINSFKIFKKCKVPVIFNQGNAGTIGDISTGALYLLIFSNANNVGTGIGYDGIDYNVQCRVRYEDP